jgi:hypothetical protein
MIVIFEQDAINWTRKNSPEVSEEDLLDEFIVTHWAFEIDRKPKELTTLGGQQK